MEKCLYKPEVSLEQIKAFELDNPETHTSSAFINAVCTSFAVNGYRNCQEVGKSLGMSAKDFSSTFATLTGCRYTEVRKELVLDRALQLRAKHPHWSTERLAKEMGFNHRSSLWSMVPKGDYAELHTDSRGEFIQKKLAAYRRELEREFDEGAR